MIYGNLILIIFMMITISIMLWMTYKKNRIYINAMFILLIICNILVYTGVVKQQSALNRNAYYVMNRFEDSLIRFNKFSNSVKSMDDVRTLSAEIDELYKVTSYLESIKENLTISKLKTDEFEYIITSLNKWIDNYREIHRKLFKENSTFIEINFDSYNKIASILANLENPLEFILSNYYDTFHILIFDLSFKENSYSILSTNILELNELLDTLDSN